jgi:hypothetical protein
MRPFYFIPCRMKFSREMGSGVNTGGVGFAQKPGPGWVINNDGLFVLAFFFVKKSSKSLCSTGNGTFPSPHPKRRRKGRDPARPQPPRWPAATRGHRRPPPPPPGAERPRPRANRSVPPLALTLVTLLFGIRIFRPAAPAGSGFGRPAVSRAPWIWCGVLRRPAIRARHFAVVGRDLFFFSPEVGGCWFGRKTGSFIVKACLIVSVNSSTNLVIYIAFKNIHLVKFSLIDDSHAWLPLNLSTQCVLNFRDFVCLVSW